MINIVCWTYVRGGFVGEYVTVRSAIGGGRIPYSSPILAYW